MSFFAEGWKRVRHQSLGQERRDKQKAGFSRAGLRAEVCVRHEGQTMRPVRSKSVARGPNVAEFDLGGVEDSQEKCNVGLHASERSVRCHGTWTARVMEERTENGPGCCRSLAHPRKPSGNAMWCLTCRSGTGVGTVGWEGS